jgi:hypothetical protein
MTYSIFATHPSDGYSDGSIQMIEKIHVKIFIRWITCGVSLRCIDGSDQMDIFNNQGPTEIMIVNFYLDFRKF